MRLFLGSCGGGSKSGSDGGGWGSDGMWHVISSDVWTSKRPRARTRAGGREAGCWNI